MIPCSCKNLQAVTCPTLTGAVMLLISFRLSGGPGLVVHSGKTSTDRNQNQNWSVMFFFPAGVRSSVLREKKTSESASYINNYYFYYCF